MKRNFLKLLTLVGSAALIAGCGDSGSSSTSGGGGEGAGTTDGGGGSGAGTTDGGGGSGAGTTNGGGGEGGGTTDTCGNDQVEGNESCDGDDLDGNSCEDFGFAGGELGCDSDCMFDTSACTGKKGACGDGVLDAGESCDSDELDGEDCASQGFDSGTLACDDTCEFDTSACVNKSCGDGIINGKEACDGLLLGDATCMTEGFDGGEISCTANCALDVSGCTNEDCTNTTDDDGDLLADCADDSCAVACADSCAEVPTITDPIVELMGDTTDHANLVDSACVSQSGGGSEVVYRVVAAQTGMLDITLAGDADMGFAVWSACGSEELGCLDDNVDANEAGTIPVTAGDELFISVEGWSADVSGPYTLTVASRPTVCGDGFVEGAEACDDGNLDADDGCSPTCVIECGDTVCGANEDACNCAADCNVPDSCSACECAAAPVPNAACQCDFGCIGRNDCCVDQAAVCGAAPTPVTITSGPINVVMGDNNYNGSGSSMTCITVPSAGNGTVADFGSVSIALAHTWVGDLTIKLVSPAGSLITLMSRPGMAEPGDDGTDNGFGSGANAVANIPLIFTMDAATSAETMGVGLGSNSTVCAASPCEWIPNNGAALPATTLNDLAGQTADGNWQVCLGDSGSGDIGGISDVTLSFLAN